MEFWKSEFFWGVLQGVGYAACGCYALLAVFAFVMLARGRLYRRPRRRHDPLALDRDLRRVDVLAEQACLLAKAEAIAELEEWARGEGLRFPGEVETDEA